MSAREIKGLVANPVPAYIVGVEERENAAYLVSANGELDGGLGSLPTNFPLGPETVKLLWDEVHVFWGSVAPANFVSRFADPARRN